MDINDKNVQDKLLELCPKIDSLIHEYYSGLPEDNNNDGRLFFHEATINILSIGLLLRIIFSNEEARIKFIDEFIDQLRENLINAKSGNEEISIQ